MFKKFLVRRKAIAPGVIIKPTARIRPVAERVTNTVKEIIESKITILNKTFSSFHIVFFILYTHMAMARYHFFRKKRF